MQTRPVHIIFADDHVVVATTHEGAFGYCRNALELEGRHEIRCETQQHMPSVFAIDYVACDHFLDLGHNPAPEDLVFEPSPIFRTRITPNLIESVDQMRTIIHERILNPLDTGDPEGKVQVTKQQPPESPAHD